jgi:hypothetical protein
LAYGVRLQLTTGRALVLPQLARNPMVAVALAPSEEFQVSFRTETDAPDWVYWPPQSWVMVCPFANDQVSVHPVVVLEPVLVTIT